VAVLSGVTAMAVCAASASSDQPQRVVRSAAMAKYLPPYYQAPSGFCAGRNIARAGAYAPKRKFVVNETTGDARGPHIFTASISSTGYDCADGRSQVNFAFVWDMRFIHSTTISGQVQVTRMNGTRRATKIFDLKPGSAWRCCDVAKYLPTLTFARPASRLKRIAVVPLFNKSPTLGSVADTKGGLKADYKYLPFPRG
jgi:hypothetical protein